MFCYFLEVRLILEAGFKNSNKAQHMFNSCACTNKPSPGSSRGRRGQKTSAEWWASDFSLFPTLRQTLLCLPVSEGWTQDLPLWNQEPFCPQATPGGMLWEEESHQLPTHQQTPRLPEPGLSLEVARYRSYASPTGPFPHIPCVIES